MINASPRLQRKFTGRAILHLSRALLAAVALLLCDFSPGSAQECRQFIEAFNQAIESGDEHRAQAILDKIAVDAECGRLQVSAQRRLAAFRLRAAQTLMARGRPYPEYERLLTEADKPEVLWQAAATLGDVRFGERRFAESAKAFDRAIEIIRNEVLTPNAPSKFEIEDLFARAAEARLLAANQANGREGTFVQTARNQRDGKLGGVYASNVRGVTVQVVPVPITFEFAKTAFTGVGERAARELLTAIQEQMPSRIILVGHTDVRGTSENNMKLSKDRADAVAEFLRQNGTQIPMETIGMGETEPLQLSDTSGLSQDDIYALNRRVEWRRTK